MLLVHFCAVDSDQVMRPTQADQGFPQLVNADGGKKKKLHTLLRYLHNQAVLELAKCFP